jgi:Mn2+/Fe2+ NRAMP family transporter
VIVAAVLVLAAVSTGSFKRFERVSMILVAGSLLLIPIFVLARPNLGQMAVNFVVPGMPAGAQLSTVMLLIIGIVGTTVAPWQLFFQQSYVIDKRITPRFMNYEKVDLWIGIGMVMVGAAAIIGFTSSTFGGRPEFGNFTDALGVAQGLGKYVGQAAGIMFAIALIDASIIGAAAVGLSTSYALGDVLGLKHSLHRKPWEAKGFYAVFAGLLAIAATVVLIPGSPLGLLTVGVQTLAGVLLPSATVFLLLLCNDEQVLGPWVNGRWLNLFTSVVIAILVMLSIVLTASVLFPNITAVTILLILGVGSALAIAVGVVVLILRRRRPAIEPVPRMDHAQRIRWRMPPLALLARPELSTGRRVGLTVLRAYLLLAMALVVVRVIQLALGH